MTFKRLFRFAVVGGAAAAAVAAVRALTRKDDPLPSPASGPTEPWPPLREATSPSTSAATSTVPEPVEDDPEPLLTVAAPAAPTTTDEPEPEPEPEPPAKKARRSRPLRAPWMPPEADGSCPEGYPLKANDQSMIFHAPGQMSYDRTVPERCYADPEAAIADGYRAAKR